MGKKAAVGVVGLGTAGALLLGPAGALAGVLIGGILGAAGDAADAQSERNEALKDLNPNASAGQIASTLKRAGRSSFTHTHEREVQVGGEKVVETRTRKIRRG